ncbi:hypothetical protein AA313_de0204959 [Arthrobotrys entomopaga]|nr:hypothetical protein AA313_de0204959 [Arthrobotrys entomopaga]
MKFTIVALAAAAATASAELVFDNGTFKCLGDAAGKNFCAGDSLQTNIIIRCTGETGQPGNCNDNLAGVPPVGVKTFAPCYQTSNTTGDAACSFNGIAYPDSGNSFPIPGASSSSSAAPTYGGSSSSSVPIYTTSVPVYTSSVPVYTSAPVYSNSTLTTSIVVEPTTTATYVPPPPPTTNSTMTYTSSLPPPTQSPSSAGALFVRQSIVLGAVALAGFLLL